MHRIAALALLVCALVIPPPATADDLTAAKTADIKRLLDLTGAYRVGQILGGAMVRQLSESLRQSRPDIPPDLFTALEEEVNKVIAEEMTAAGGFSDVVVEVYHHHLTHDDVRGLIAFYSTPLGRKLTQELPAMTQESMQAGARWGISLGPKIEQRIRARFKERGVEL